MKSPIFDAVEVHVTVWPPLGTSVNFSEAVQKMSGMKIVIQHIPIVALPAPGRQVDYFAHGFTEGGPLSHRVVLDDGDGRKGPMFGSGRTGYFSEH